MHNAKEMESEEKPQKSLNEKQQVFCTSVPVICVKVGFSYSTPYYCSCHMDVLDYICCQLSLSRRTRTCSLSAYQMTLDFLGEGQLQLVSYIDVFFIGDHLKWKGQAFLIV